MIISVASGKGGTGKTTVATNLALSLKNVQFFDCDVEEPDSNIFINAEISDSKEVNVMIPEIDKEKCNFCGKCSEFCRYNALAVVKSNALVFPELCHSCGGCELVCPTKAIRFNHRSIGKIEYGKKDGIEFYQGILNIGEIQAIPVLKELKKYIDKEKNVILDAPPGTACPFVETVEGTDYCILVTEPTPFGLNDLKLAVDTARLIGVPFGVIINREGIGDNSVELYLQKEKIPILLKIPQSTEIAKLYSDGIAFVKKIPEWRIEFKKIFSIITKEVLK